MNEYNEDNDTTLEWVSTLLYSFGSDAPQEVYWGINEMIDWLNDKHGFELKHLICPYWTESAEESEQEVYKKQQDLSDALRSLKI